MEPAVRERSSSRLRVSLHRGPYGCPVVSPDGDVDFSNRDELAEQRALAAQAGAAVIFVDLRRLSFIDSSGVHVIRQAAATAEPGRILIVRAPAHIQRIVAFLGLEDAFDFIDVLPGE